MFNKIIIIVMIAAMLLFSSCSRQQSVCIIVDQTDSTKYIRSNENIKKLCDAIRARPNFQVKMIGMMPDRIYPISSNDLNKSYGVNGTKYTGGDLESAIKKAIELTVADTYIIITDGENNFGNVEHGVPNLPPGNYIFVGIQNERWQSYLDKNYEAYTIDQVPDLLKKIVIHGTL